MSADREALLALSEAATPGEWAERYLGRGKGSNFGDGRGNYLGEAVRHGDAQFIVSLVNAYRSGKLVEAEPLLALLAEAREWIDPTENWEAAALRSRIDAALAAEPEARA